MELFLVIKQDKAGHNNLEQSCERKSDYSDFLVEFVLFSKQILTKHRTTWILEYTIIFLFSIWIEIAFILIIVLWTEG